MKPLTFILVVFTIIGLTVLPVWMLAGCIKMGMTTQNIVYVESITLAFSVSVIYMLIKSYLTFKD